MPNLVGIGNSQVPTNAMLGGLAYQDSVGEINIDKIKAKTPDNALNIFVYDTRKDSDGGAWRKKATTQSWYNEVVSGERGARREFPSVAVIVVMTTAITIYDGDDPNLPMWMVLNEGGSSRMLYSSSGSDFSGAVSALNGNIYYGMTGNGTLGIIEFIRDSAFKHRNNNRTNRGRWRGTIADRNLALGWFTENDIRLAGEAVSDLATTVLPNAPIETTSGLPVPTIAAATSGGTSIIKHDGTIVDIVYTGSPDTAYVDFRKSDNAIVMSMNSNASYVHVIYDIPTSDISGSHQYQKEGIDDEFYRTGSSQDWNQEVWIHGASPFGSSVRIANNIISGNRGINVLSPSRTASATDTMVANITSSFNTGYMHGDIRGAFLSDTSTDNLTSTELIANGGPFSNTTGWVADNGFAISNTNNRLKIDSNGNGGSYFGAYYAFTTVVGKKYVLTVDIHSQNAGSVVRLSGSGTYFTETSLGTGEHAFYFTSDQAATTVRIGSNVGAGSNRVQEISNVSVREVEEDRSVKNKGLQPNGTITKEPVATGAELVAYSGFTSGNYLQITSGVLGSNTSTDGPLTVMCWFKGGLNGSNTQTLVMIGPALANQARGLLLDTSGNLGWFRWNSDPFSSTNVTNGSWHHCVGTLDSSSTVKLYVDGELVYNQSITLATSSSTQVRIGYSNGNNAPLANGSLALVRISNSVASSDQIKKIYDDEKCLYHENAKCTLHGTSDDVKALAFDDTNNVLHVGTSSGRSEFQGLNRINNTTTAVTTAISASNELVAEQ